MTPLESLLLGGLQGITEFLPISSTAHLIFLQNLFGIKEPQLLFNVLVHFSTLFAVIILFYKDIINYVKSPKILFLIILATIPTGIIGLVIKKYFTYIFASVVISAIMLYITGILVFIIDRKKSNGRKIENMNVIQALMIGMSQGLSVIPGISRSGATLSTAILLGLNKSESLKFIFILSIPAILGATFVELKDVIFTYSSFTWSFIYGMFSAFVCGILSIKTLMKVLEKGKIRYFSYYCWLVASLALVINSLTSSH